MAKLKKVKADFTMVSNGVLRNPEASLKAKGLYAYLYSKPDDWDFSAKRIAKENKDEVDSIGSGLKELEALGYLIRKKLKTGRVQYLIQVESTKPKEPEPEPEKPKNKAKKYVLPDWLDQEAWGRWGVYRKEIKKALTSSTIKLQLKFLEKNQSNHTEIIDRSIQNGWTGLFPINDNRKQGPAIKPKKGKYNKIKSTKI